MPVTPSVSEMVLKKLRSFLDMDVAALRIKVFVSEGMNLAYEVHHAKLRREIDHLKHKAKVANNHAARCLKERDEARDAEDAARRIVSEICDWYEVVEGGPELVDLTRLEEILYGVKGKKPV